MVGSARPCMSARMSFSSRACSASFCSGSSILSCCGSVVGAIDILAISTSFLDSSSTVSRCSNG